MVFFSVLWRLNSDIACPAASVSHRLTLLYVANDVIQNSKKKGITFYADGFENVLRECMSLLMDEKIRANVLRVLNIWSDRNVYRPSFIQELQSAIPYSETVSNESSATTKIMAEFKMKDLFDGVEQLRSLENDSASKIDQVKGAQLAALNSEILTHLKDKTLGDHLIKEADEASRLLHEVLHALDREQRHRHNVIDCLNKALIYTVVQNNEVDQEFKAYVRIGQNAAKVLTILTSPGSGSVLPLPSDVPSPTNSDDGPILPADNEQNKHTSSLDQRLETILCAIKGPAPAQIPGGNNVPPLSAYHSAALHDQDSRPGFANRSNPSVSGSVVAQPILPLVSSRPGVSQALMAPIPGLGFASSENFEPADMDITNSDEDDPYVPGPRGPNLRIIEPMRNTNEYVPETRRVPDQHAPKSRGRDQAMGWSRMAGDRLSPRSQHASSSIPHQSHGHRWNQASGRMMKQTEAGARPDRRRSGSFRQH